jgi:hypothetical protein
MFGKKKTPIEPLTDPGPLLILVATVSDQGFNVRYHATPQWAIDQLRMMADHIEGEIGGPADGHTNVADS